MGVAESKPHMVPPFQRLSEWTLARVEKLLNDYVAKDLDFGLDAHGLSILLDGDKEWSEAIIKAFGSPNGLINVLSFITGAGLAVMGEPQDKASLCFRAFDFSNTGSISLDETTIMFICALRGFIVITGQGRLPPDDTLEATALEVYKMYDKDNYSKLAKDEFLKWISKKLAVNHAADLTPSRFLRTFGAESPEVEPSVKQADDNQAPLPPPIAEEPPTATVDGTQES
ncbi:unnamed protein product [Aphanomyces euteiches]